MAIPVHEPQYVPQVPESATVTGGSLGISGPLPAGANIIGAVAQSGTWNVNISNASIPVTGTFWQSTQPVSIAATVAVSGTFFQATQPVSIASMPTTPVTGTFWQATQPVSGTFWQSTQPVSIASMPTTPVTGTFFQATQPVSIAAMPTTPVTGTFWPANQPVSLPLGQTTLSNSTPVAIASDQILPTSMPGSTRSAVSITEQMDQLFAAQCATVHLLSQLLSVCRGVVAPLPGDEADQLIGEFMDARSNTSNIMN